jgi:hypothetical protein
MSNELAAGSDAVSSAALFPLLFEARLNDALALCLTRSHRRRRFGVQRSLRTLPSPRYGNAETINAAPADVTSAVRSRFSSRRIKRLHFVQYRSSGQNIRHDFAVDVGQSEITTLCPVGQLFVVDS